MNDQPTSEANQKNQETVSTEYRPLIFLGTYIIGVMVTTLLIPHSTFALDWPTLLVILLLAFIYLPWGLVGALKWVLQHAFGIHTNMLDFFSQSWDFYPVNKFGWVIIGLSYLLLFIIPLVGSLTKKEQIFRILYFIFIGLLITNIGGCLNI